MANRIKRSLSVEISMIETSKRWSNAALRVIELVGWEGKHSLRNVATIEINSPSDVAQMRRALDSIEHYWREELDGLKR